MDGCRRPLNGTMSPSFSERMYLSIKLVSFIFSNFVNEITKVCIQVKIESLLSRRVNRLDK